MCLQLIAKMFQRRRRRGKAQVRLVRGEREQEARLDEERVAPLDRLIGLGRGAFMGE
jgi:hypothetical protein